MPKNPDNLWDAKRCAEFLGVSYDHFRKTRHDSRYPRPLDLPGRLRWKPEDWQNQPKISNFHPEIKQAVVLHKENT